MSRQTSFSVDPALKQWATRYHALLGHRSRAAMISALLEAARDGDLTPKEPADRFGENETASATVDGDLYDWARNGEHGYQDASKLVDDLLRAKRDETGDVYGEVDA